MNMKIFKLASWEVPSTSIQGNEWKLAWRSPLMGKPHQCLSFDIELKLKST